MLLTAIYMNLECLSNIRTGEFIQCDEHGEILSYLQHSFHNYSTKQVFEENLSLTMKCIDQLYKDELPLIIDSIISDKKKKPIRDLHHKLTKALTGLEVLRTSYKTKNAYGDEHIDILINTYCKDQIKTVSLIC